MGTIYRIRTGAVAFAAGVLILILATNAQARWNCWNCSCQQYSPPCSAPIVPLSPTPSVPPSASVSPPVPGGQTYTARYGSYNDSQVAPAIIAPVFYPAFYPAPAQSLYDQGLSAYNQWGSER